ncbi:MAG: alpha/beta fold hydrolase [Planctomycetes bacterium]|nr:alpha/beta fold hydrolase [Planctomycetota bacterium]
MSHGCTSRRIFTSPNRSFVFCALLVVNLATFAGCKCWSKPAEWRDGECRYDHTIHHTATEVVVAPAGHTHGFSKPLGCPKSLVLAREASNLEAAGDALCVDAYYAAACQAWREVAALGRKPSRTELAEVSQPYHACVAKLIVTADRFHKIDPDRGLQVLDHGRQVIVPIERLGFAWSSEDFNGFELVGEYKIGKRSPTTRTTGLGVPLVVKRLRCQRDEFYREVQPFAATAVLCPREPRPIAQRSSRGRAASATNEPEIVTPELLSAETCFELRLYNPLNCAQVELTSGRWPLAGDQTAPLAWQMSQSRNNPVQAFLRPDANDAEPQLVMLEPYQAGKIPVVFVHGLLSDPSTWIDLGNQLRAQAWFRERYQVWVFRYPTGAPFLVSAAALRRELNAALHSAPEAEGDLAGNFMVLVGHSMGGLVSKLQVTDSGNRLWELVANRPMDQLVASDADRNHLQQVFCFEPQPFVRHVVFIGTPHRGSTMARRGIGRLTSLVARESSEAKERQRRLMDDNPGAFKTALRMKIPTSVDLLEPSNPLLAAMEQMPIAPCVQLHSIIGVAKPVSCEGPGDGVVTVASATHPGVASEKLVDEKHEELHHAAATVIELERILQQNARDYARALDRGEMRNDE